MTRGSVEEYAEAVLGRYQRASRKDEGRIPDEFIQVSGYHRKAAIRLLNGHYGHNGRLRKLTGQRHTTNYWTG